MRAYLIVSTALAAILCPAAAAADAAAVDELIVTATRLPSTPELVTGARVIDAGEIERRGTPFVTDLLATVPGVGVTRNGPFGGIGAIRIRGAGPDKTLVLIDGVPVGDAADPNGTFDPGALQTSDLERVEVLSGPQSSLWGSEAIGGVVAFTTRELDGWRIEAEAGAFDTLRGFVGAGVATDRYALNGSVAAFRTDGISKADLGTEKDGFETFTANVGGRADLGALRLDGRVRYTQSLVDIDGFAPPDFVLGDLPDQAKNHAWSGLARGTFEALGLTHQASVSLYDFSRRNQSAFPTRFTADRRVLRWTAARGEALIFGVERQDTEADLSGRPSLDLSTSSAFAVGRISPVDRLTLTASLRHDEPDAFDGRTTGRLAAAAELPAGFTATVSAGTGFKTPTISQAVCDFCFSPPVPLTPEKAEGWDVRLGWTGDRVSAAVTGWRLLVRDEIAYREGRYVNIAKTRSTGIEAELDAELSDALRLKLAYAWTDAIDGATGGSLIRTPDHAGSAALFYEAGPWSGALTVRAESSQTDTARDGFTRVRRDGFVTADASGAYDLNDRVTLTARIENLTDERYQETFGYAEAGRAAYVGVRIRN